MKTATLIPFALVLAGLTIGCTSTDKPDVRTDRLHETIDRFYQAVNDGDAETVIDIFADDATVMPNGGEIIKGKAAIAEMWRRGSAAGFRIRNIAVVRLDVSCDIAYKLSTYEWGMVQDNQETTWYPTKNIHIFKRQPDGTWKLQADIWNESPWPESSGA